jgi:hypothetical protein
VAAPESGLRIAYRIDQRAAQTEPPAVLLVPAPLNQLSWEFAKDQFGVQGADFIGALGAQMVHTAKDGFRAYLIDPTRLPGTLPPPRKTSPGLGHSEPAGDDATRISPTRPALGTSAGPPTAPAAAAAAMVSLAESSQQTPIVVVLYPGCHPSQNCGSKLAIHKRYIRASVPLYSYCYLEI